MRKAFFFSDLSSTQCLLISTWRLSINIFLIYYSNYLHLNLAGGLKQLRLPRAAGKTVPIRKRLTKKEEGRKWMWMQQSRESQKGAWWKPILLFSTQRHTQLSNYITMTHTQACCLGTVPSRHNSMCMFTPLYTFYTIEPVRVSVLTHARVTIQYTWGVNEAHGKCWLCVNCWMSNCKEKLPKLKASILL